MSCLFAPKKVIKYLIVFGRSLLTYKTEFYQFLGKEFNNVPEECKGWKPIRYWQIKWTWGGVSTQ